MWSYGSSSAPFFVCSRCQLSTVTDEQGLRPATEGDLEAKFPSERRRILKAVRAIRAEDGKIRPDELLDEVNN